MPFSATDAQQALTRLMTRVSSILEAVGSGFPLFAHAGNNWETTEDGNWCAGYWIGLLWLAAHHAPDDAARIRFHKAAYALLPKMLSQDTDNLFAGLNHNYAGFLGYELTGDEELRTIGLRGAKAMCDLFNPNAQQIPIGTYATAPLFSSNFRQTMPRDRRFLAAVDVIHTSVPILLNAYDETGDQPFLETALAHVHRHLEWHVRADGSTVQMTAFDPASGARGESFNPLANGPNGCWSRGLGWHIAGLAAVCRHTGDAAMLAVLENSVDFFLTHTDETGVPAWDFAANDPIACRDASAAAVTAYGLINLASRGGAETQTLERTGSEILKGLISSCQINDEARPDHGAIVHGCYRHPEGLAVDSELIWSDFYTALALHRLITEA